MDPTGAPQMCQETPRIDRPERDAIRTNLRLMVRESTDPGAADTASHRDGWCRRDRLAAARGGCDNTRAPNPGVYDCHPGRGAAPGRTVGSSQRGITRAAETCRLTLSTCELPVAEQSSRAGAVTGVGVEEPHSAGSRRPTHTCSRVRTGLPATNRRDAVCAESASRGPSLSSSVNRHTGDRIGDGAGTRRRSSRALLLSGSGSLERRGSGP